VDSEGVEIPHRGLAEQILANLRHHQHLRTAQPGGNRLVGSLTAKAEIEVLTEQSLPRPRKRVGKRNQVRVGAAYDGNPGCIRHVDLSRSLTRDVLPSRVRSARHQKQSGEQRRSSHPRFSPTSARRRGPLWPPPAARPWSV